MTIKAIEFFLWICFILFAFAVIGLAWHFIGRERWK